MDATETTAAIDRALAGDPPATADPLERELAELTRLLATEAPTPDPDFATELCDRAAASFRTSERSLGAYPQESFARRLAGRVASWPPSGIAGALACVAIGLVAVAGLAGDDLLGREGGGESQTAVDVGATAGGADTPAFAPPSADADATEGGDIQLAPPHDADPSTASPQAQTDLRSGTGPAILDRGAIGPTPPIQPVPPALRGRVDRDFAPGADARRIERSATVVLAAPDSRLDRVAGGIARVTDRHDGFVLSSELAVGDDGAASGGEFELRIPSGRLGAALADLGRLAQVRSRTTAGRDVTAATVTSGDRLQAARAERRGLLERLESATTDNQAAALRIRLDANAREIDRLTARLRALRLRADYATVAVTLQSADAEPTGGAEGNDGLGAALDDAADSLSGALELAIRILGVALPIALIAAAAWLATRTLERRRREAALRDAG